MSIKQELLQSLEPQVYARLAESLGITEAEAKAKVRNMSFVEYLQLTEANTDSNPWLTTGTTSSSAKPLGQNNDSDNNEVDINDLDIAGMSDEEVDNLYQAIEVWDSEMSNPADKRRDIEQKLKDPQLQDKMKQHMSNFKSGFAEAEISRLRELAGITETATVGSTCSGNVSGMPSIIGDTSDSHKPTNKLITRMKRKREEKQREREKRLKKRKAEGRDW